ncbi:hypothetical protein [Thermovenabulum sp.]|uniref:hypothetical protein n=1 Tax=Thermovenabulum sp. TaxID=3100335 RepID=UPI003C7BC15B
MKKIFSKLLITISYLIVWAIVYFAVIKLFSDSPSKTAYGLLSGWWAGLYFSLLFEIKINDLPIIVGEVAFIFFICSIINKDLRSFLRDIDEMILFVSPILISSSFNFVKSKYMHYKNKMKENKN